MTVWDRILTSTPINREAALHLSKGDGTDELQQQLNVFEIRPPEMPKPNDPNFVDFEGTKLGRLTILGYAGAGKHSNGKAHKKGALWNARCSCSRFMQIRSKTIKDTIAGKCDTDRCQDCRHLRRIQLGYGRAEHLDKHQQKRRVST